MIASEQDFIDAVSAFPEQAVAKEFKVAEDTVRKWKSGQLPPAFTRQVIVSHLMSQSGGWGRDPTGDQGTKCVNTRVDRCVVWTL